MTFIDLFTVTFLLLPFFTIKFLDYFNRFKIDFPYLISMLASYVMFQTLVKVFLVINL